MKKFALVLSILASAFVLASCASKVATTEQAPAMSDSSAQTAAAPAKHHDFKGEGLSK